MGLNLLMEKDASGTTTKTYTHGYSPVDGIGSVVVANDSVHGYQYPTYDHRGTVQEDSERLPPSTRPARQRIDPCLPRPRLRRFV